MKALIKLLIACIISFILMVMIFGCQKTASPTVIYQDKIVSKIDTILNSRFDTIVIYKNDTCSTYKMSFNSLLNYYTDAQKIIKTHKNSKRQYGLLSFA